MVSIFDRDPLTGTTDDALLSGLTEDELLFGTSDDFLFFEKHRSRIRERENLNLLKVANDSSPVLPIATNPTDLGIPTCFDNKKIMELNNATTILSLPEDNSLLDSINGLRPDSSGVQVDIQSDNSPLSDTNGFGNSSSSNLFTLTVNNLVPLTTAQPVPPAPAQPVLKSATLNDTNGKDGIDSRWLLKLGLTGKGIAIGQVEPDRPGDPSFDDREKSHEKVKPKGVFVMDRSVEDEDKNKRIDSHATAVAGVMIAQDNKDTGAGVALGALLYSSLYSSGLYRNGSPNALRSMQYVATQNQGDVRAINLSFGRALEAGKDLDGSSLLTLGLDWSAREHDVLYVQARGNTWIPNIVVPVDNFNGIKVGATTRKRGGFNQVADFNNFTVAADGRKSLTDILAPGDNILMPSIGNTYKAGKGTSFAAPHVTGTVALLQEYGDEQITKAKKSTYIRRWDDDARRHEVMKAVLMNSADKKEGILGMEKTILRQDGIEDWLHSDAYRNQEIPLDDEMGTGQLNARRAFKQFKPGEWGPADLTFSGETKVPLIGWDSSFEFGKNKINKYTIGEPLKKGSYISITLTWDRVVNLKEVGKGNHKFDPGESFESIDLTNLDLYLLHEGAKDTSKAVDASISKVDNVEHIFFKIPEEAIYEFWVQQKGGDTYIPYGLAWWAQGLLNISFSAPSYKVSENGTIIGSEITLIRTGDTSGASTVDVVFADGTSTGGADYDNTIQTIFFAANQTSATIVIPINDDSLVENTESLTMKLINPSEGTEIGDQSIANLNILDNDMFSGGNPGHTIVGGYPGDTLVGGNPNDTLIGGHPSDTIIGGVRNDMLDGVILWDTLVGADFNDTLTGTYRDEILVGGDSNDALIEGSNNSDCTDVSSYDTLVGGSNDTVHLSSGQDTFFSRTYGINTASLSLAGVSSKILPFKETQFLNLAPAEALPSLT